MIRVLLLVLALLQAGGVLDVLRRASCEEMCRRDGCDGPCTPDDNTPRCSCHTPGATPIASVVETCVSAPAQVAVIGFARAERAPMSPDPREILHVPRA